MMSGTVRIRKVVPAIHVALPVLWRIFLDMTAASKVACLEWITRFFPWDDQWSGRRKRSLDLTKCWTSQRSTESLLSLICQRRSLRSCTQVWLKLSLSLSLSLWTMIVICLLFCLLHSLLYKFLFIFALFLELSDGVFINICPVFGVICWSVMVLVSVVLPFA